MSVGDVDGDRSGSLKLTGEENPPPPEPEQSDLVAQDDFAFVTLLDLEEPAGQSDGISLGDALANDYDPDPEDTFEIISVSGADGTDSTADENGWFGWVEGSNGGELRLNLDGTYQIRDPGGEDFVNPGLFDPLTTTIDYEIMDNHGVIASATIHVDIAPATSLSLCTELKNRESRDRRRSGFAAFRAIRGTALSGAPLATLQSSPKSLLS